MDTSHQQAILTIALMAAFADGQKAEAERQAIRQLAASLDQEGAGVDLNRIYQDVLLKKVSLTDAVVSLRTPEYRQLAYEMAVGVCDADGQQSAAERVFLANLRTGLNLPADEAAVVERQERELMEATDAAVPAMLATGAVAVTAGAVAVSAMASDERAGALSEAQQAQIDKTILNSALINGALELLPQSWASMAIIPLQVRMVHSIGKAHGIELDQGHVREFIATVGVGLASQYIEQFGRRLVGGLLGKVAGRAMGGVARAGTGMAFSFATTYALGHVAKRYYAGGRVMSTALLKETFQDLLGPAKQMQTRYMPQIQQTASSLDMGKVLSMVRGGSSSPL